MNNKVILKAELPLFSTFHYQLTAGVALAENPTGENWYFNECNTLQCGRRFLTGYSSPELNVCRTELAFVSPVEKIPYDLRFLKEELHSMIKRILRSDYYVAFENFDDYYIQGKSCYGQRHLTHDGLICGYDDKKKTYSIMAYDTNWVCRVFETPQKCLEQAMMFLPEEELYSRLQAAKAKNIVLEPNLTKIKEGLIDYLDSNLDRYSPREDKDAFGTVVNDYVCMYIDLLRTEKIPYEKRDRRVFRVLWEFRRCMYLRLLMIDKLLKTNMVQDYKGIMGDSNLMRMMYAKYIMKQDNNLLLSLKKQLQKVLVQEKNILEQVILALEKGGY